jgi:hypothetical protein
LRHGLRDADTVSVKPIRTQVTTDVELGIVVRFATDTVKFYLVASAASTFRQSSFGLPLGCRWH